MILYYKYFIYIDNRLNLPIMLIIHTAAHRKIAALQLAQLNGKSFLPLSITSVFILNDIMKFIIASIKGVVMIATKRKRKLTFEGKNYYWYIREEGTDWRSPVIHIISEDKKLRLAYHFDRDIAIGTQYIKELLAMYFTEYTGDH